MYGLGLQAPSYGREVGLVIWSWIYPHGLDAGTKPTHGGWTSSSTTSPTSHMTSPSPCLWSRISPSLPSCPSPAHRRGPAQLVAAVACCVPGGGV